MEETIWIGKSGGKTSDPNNWDNGVPNYRKTVVFEVSERTEITWDLKSLGIPVEYRCDPEYVIIYISGDCMVGGSYFVPDAIRDHFESFKDESLNPDVLDGPPPGYGMFNAPTVFTWTNDYDGNSNWEQDGNWDISDYPESQNHKALFDGTPDDNCTITDALTIGEIEIQSGYTGKVSSGGTFTVTTNGQGTGLFEVSGGTFDCVTYNSEVQSNLTIGSSGTLDAGMGTFTVSGDWENSGTFTKIQSTVVLNGSSGQTLTSGGDTFFNLTFDNSHGTAKIIIADALDVYRTFALTDGQIDINTNNPAVNTSWNVTIASGCTIEIGLTRTATWTFDGTTDYTDNTPLTPQDIGNISVNGSSATLTLASGIQVWNITINDGDTLDAGGAYTIYVSGSWSMIAGGTFTQSTSTVDLNGAADLTLMVWNEAFYNLTISNSNSKTIDLSGELRIDETFDCSNSDCTLDLNPYAAKVYNSGDVIFADGFTIDEGGDPWTFEGTLEYTDNNSTAQNLGDLILDAPGLGSITATLDTHIRFNSITIEANSTLDSGDQDIYNAGDWTRNDTGAFTYGTSHVHFEGGATISGMSGSTHRFADLTINSFIDVYTPTMVELIPPDGAINGCLTDNYGSSTDVLQIVKDLTVSGTFHVSDRQVLDVC